MGARRLLLPFSWLYGAAVAARNFLYDKRLFGITTIGTPVISVGNITAGGTGKTPLVEYIVGRLLGAGARPAVLSRGYRRSTGGTLTVSDGAAVMAGADAAGDEPAQIARKLPGCVVVVDEDRVRGARFIEKEFRPDAIVLDDGFQHRSLGRDLDIVVLAGDAGGTAASEPLLPAGNGREPLGSLKRADLIVMNSNTDDKITAARSGERGSGAAAPVVRMEYALRHFVRTESGAIVGRDEIASGRFVAFCGIGNPASFRATLSSEGLEPGSFLAFPDHHRYTGADLAGISGELGRSGGKFVVTTEKDAVRLEGESSPPVPFRSALVTAVISARMAEGGEILDRAVLAAAGRTLA